MNRPKYARNTFKNDISQSTVSDSILLKLENGVRLAHTASHGYKLTMASLQFEDKKLPNCICNGINKSRDQSQEQDNVTVIIEHDLKEFILCILNGKLQNQCKLDCKIQPGEQVAFRAIGNCPVLLTGYTGKPF